jgi:polyketide synthase 13
LMGEGEAMLFGEYIRLMALVEYSADEIKTVFSDFPDLEVCVYAAPTQTVIGGPPEQVDAIIARAESEGKFARKFQTKGASHTSQMDPLLGELAAELQGIKPMSPTCGIYSTVHEGSYIKPGGEPIHDVEYWKKGLRHSVYFTHGIRNAVDSGHTTFLELAPNPVALMQVGLTTASAGLHDAQLIPTLARKQDEVESMVSAMAQLYVHGHDLDIWTLFGRPASGPLGPEDYANIPPTRFKRKEHWLDVNFSHGTSSVVMPGAHVALPDGRHVWEYTPRGLTDLPTLVKTAAVEVLPDAQLAAAEERAKPADGAALVTTLTRHPGGASVQVHARIDESFTLVYDALVTRGGAEPVVPAAVGAGTAIAAAANGAAAAPQASADGPEPEALGDSLTNRYMPAGFTKWSPDSGETVADRLGAIVGAAMGYEPEDLPWEVPLIELGLDSLMAVRIKNRVEYDFDLPPIQLAAVRDANLYNIEELIKYAVEHRDEVQQLHEHQKTQTPEEIARAQAQLISGATAASVVAPAPDPQAEPETQQAPASEAAIPPPPTDPSGPGTNGGQPNLAPDLKGAAEALSQEAVAKALNSDVPPRDAAERVTFATWAIVTGKSPGGIFNPLPKLDADAAAKMAQRLAERADGPITAEDVLASANIEELADKVRTHLEAGELDGFVRTIRAPQDDSQVPVFVFHPAGGSTVVYEPLLNRLPADTPMYGLERVEGTVQERAAQYVPKLLEINADKPFVLVGWSLGGALAYACAIGLKRMGANVAFVGLIDTVRAGEEIPQTKEETRKRWDRYARFAERTFNVDIPAIPYEQLEELDDEGQVKFVLEIVQQSGVQVPGGIIEHQRTSYLDNRALETVQIEPYDGHVTLYMADRYHDDVIEFEPRYAIRQPDGGWGEYVSDLEVVPIGGEHIQAIDEPIIGKVGAHLTQALNEIKAQRPQANSGQGR